jgi:3-phytase
MKRLVFFLAFLGVGCAGMQENQSSPPALSGSVIRLELKDPPLLGTTPAGDRIYLGGFSGLRYLGRSSTGKLRFLTHTDRGPNADEVKDKAAKTKKRPFLLPAFQPRLVILEGDPVTGLLAVEKQILLRRPDGKKLSGIPQRAGQEAPMDSLGKDIAYDPYGLDLESVAIGPDGSYWMGDEYGPTVARFSADGKMLETLKPGNGLPKIFEQRRNNRGFEGAAIFGNRLYVIMQSPLDNPKSEKEKNSKKSDVIRIAEVDAAGRRTLGQYVYVLDGGNRIGDIALEGPRVLLVIEQDGKGYRRVFRANLESATNLQLMPDRLAGPGGPIELTEDLSSLGVVAAEKQEVADLTAAGITEQKVEGIDLADGYLAIAIDNDFGMNGEWDSKTGKAGFKNEPSAIYLLKPGSWRR